MTDKLETDYQKIRQWLIMAANYRPDDDNPAHYYAQYIDRRYLGAIAFEALLLIDKMRALEADDDLNAAYDKAINLAKDKDAVVSISHKGIGFNIQKQVTLEVKRVAEIIDRFWALHAIEHATSFTPEELAREICKKA